MRPGRGPAGVLGIVRRRLSRTFRAFFDSEEPSGILLIICTALSLAVTDSAAGEGYVGLWRAYAGDEDMDTMDCAG